MAQKEWIPPIMKIYTIRVKILLDDTHQNAPSLEDCKLAVENAVLTPDNAAYGIHDVSVQGEEQIIGIPVNSKTNFVKTLEEYERFIP